MGELRIHTKFLSENMKRGDMLGDVDIDFVDENEMICDGVKRFRGLKTGCYGHGNEPFG